MEDIIKSGERIITNMYGGVPSESLNVLGYKQFASKFATGKEVIQIHTLPRLIAWIHIRNSTIIESTSQCLLPGLW
jgi:hypothetical protein